VGVHLHHNDISTIVSGVPSGAGLLVFSLGKDDRDAVTVIDNTLVGARDSGPVSLIFGVSRCSHSTNAVLNEATPAVSTKPAPIASLWLFPLAVTSSIDNSSVNAVAVTGNVFRGLAILPLRNLNPEPPAPMDSWHFFNSET
jgi:hypothetical protein